MSVFLGSNQVGSFNLIQLQDVNIDIEDSLINGSISIYNNSEIYNIGNHAFQSCSDLFSMSFPNCTSIGNYAFYECTSLISVSFPNCSYIGRAAFFNCSMLTSVDFPNCSYIGQTAFRHCVSLITINFPKCSYIGSDAFEGCDNLNSVIFPQVNTISSYAFRWCINLSIASFPKCTYIASWGFDSCYNLLSLYLLGSSVVGLNSINVFNSTPISNRTTSTGGVYGSIYVPASLYNSYITATNWSDYSARIVSV